MEQLDTKLFQNPVWAWHPNRCPHEAGYTLFRKLVFTETPSEYHLAVSADNRFTFFLDGKVLGRGPLRGDLDHYFYDEYQGELTPGYHVFAAEVVVWNNAWRTNPAPWAEIHAGGGIMVAGFAGDTRMELPEGWFTLANIGYRPLEWPEAWSLNTMIPAPPMDHVFCVKFNLEWNTALKMDFDLPWKIPVVLGKAEFRNTYQVDPDTPWNLLKRPLPQMVQTPFPIAKILEGPDSLHLVNGCLTGACPEGETSVLLDLGRNQTSMVSFTGHGGNGTCRIAYSETLFNPDGTKTRAYPGTLDTKGYGDFLKLLGDDTWKYNSFWYRTGRFIQLDFFLLSPIDSLNLSLDFITFPLGTLREFHSPQDPILEKIWQVSCHTLLCCAHEHFEDCPYYEQLQYAGDSRVEALVSYAISGNDILGRHAIEMLAVSQLDNGMTQSRYPSTFKQIIPEYCLIWSLMLHDHYTRFKDISLVKKIMPNILRMLDAFEERRRPDGLIGPMPGWHYTDWVPEWPSGASDRGQDVPETILNLFYAEACNRTADLLDALGRDTQLLRQRAQDTLNAVNALCFDTTLKRYVDAPGHIDWLSLHANTLAVLFGAVPTENRADFLRDIASDTALAPMSLYFSFYLLQAIQKYGTPEELRSHFAPWEQMLAQGCTTFPETPRPCRSDCHAWSCAPAWFLNPLK